MLISLLSDLEQFAQSQIDRSLPVLIRHSSGETLSIVPSGR